MTAGYADLGNGKLYYEMEGKGETLVLCHAGFVDSRMWDGQWDLFLNNHRFLRFDMRGFGKSDTATGPVSRREDLYNLLQKLPRACTYVRLLKERRNDYRLYT
jgi:pimeloyl-ACP methyl ester carboxylesterase